MTSARGRRSQPSWNTRKPPVARRADETAQRRRAPSGSSARFWRSARANVKDIAISFYAAALARMSVWVGEIQWMRRNGFAEARKCRDAVRMPDDSKPEWQVADIVIGNPPFLDGSS